MISSRSVDALIVLIAYCKKQCLHLSYYRWINGEVWILEILGIFRQRRDDQSNGYCLLTICNFTDQIAWMPGRRLSLPTKNQSIKFLLLNPMKKHLHPKKDGGRVLLLRASREICKIWASYLIKILQACSWHTGTACLGLLEFDIQFLT